MSDIPSPNDLEIIPQTIYISTHTGRSTFSLQSHATSGLAFKIKSNKPRDYIVEPSIGLLFPDQRIKVSIKMTNPDEFMKTDHKFKIEIYKFDCRKSLSEFKNSVNGLKFLEKKVDVCFVGDNEIKLMNMEEKIVFFVVSCMFLNLIVVMLQ